MATKDLATWAANLTPETLPPTILDAARRSLYNYIGCAIGGSQHPTVAKAYAAVSLFFGPPTSTLLGHNSSGSSSSTTSPAADTNTTTTNAPTADAQHAALLNGIASHVHDYDDTHLATIIHPSGPVVSAALAIAQHLSATGRPPVPGPALLAALVAGIEAACKLGLAVWPHHYDIGWHITSSTGGIGAAVAVGKLLGLDATQMAHAIGLAAVQPVGLREMFGSDTKSFHPGRAAQSGLLAAVLAERGYTSSGAALEAKRGWANVVAGGGTPQLERYVGELGRVWEIERNAFKPFPCGIVCHPAIDGCIQLHGEFAAKGLRVADVERVEEKVHPLVIELTSKRTPKDGLEGKFSVFHGSAVGLLYGKAGPAQYADEVVTSQEVVALRDRIEAEIDQGLRADEVHLTVYFKDGSKAEKHVDHAVGSLEVPMTDVQLTEKFVDQCTPVLGEETARVSSIAWKIGDSADVALEIQQL